MTIKELYEQAVEQGKENMELRIYDFAKADHVDYNIDWGQPATVDLDLDNQ